MDLGRSSQHDYPNSEGRPVSIRFRGLKSLVAIHDELAEFLPRRTKFDRPNYLPESIAQRLESEGVSRAEFRRGEGIRLHAMPE